MAQTARRLSEAEMLYNYAISDLQHKVVEHLHDGIRIHLSKLKEQPVPATILHETLQPFGFSTAEIALIAQNLDLQTGKLFEAQQYLAVLHRGFLEVRKSPVVFDNIPLTNGEHLLPNGITLSITTMHRNELCSIPKCADKIAIDADKTFGKMVVRSCRRGDRFQPFGMKGSKLVSDYLTDRHRSLIDKQGAFCLCDDHGIVWLAGERVAQRVAITPSTHKILVIDIKY